MTEVGVLFANLRKEQGFTQEELAEALGVDRSYISLIETGRSQPSWRLLVRFANLLHVSVNELLRATGLIEEAPIDEDHIAKMVAAYPRLAAIFEYAKDDREVLADLARYADMLIREREARHATEHGGGVTTEGED